MNDFKIRLEKISKEYEGIKVLNNVDFELKPGRVHVLDVYKRQAFYCLRILNNLKKVKM